MSRRVGWVVCARALAAAVLGGCGDPCDTLWFRDFDGDGAGDPRRTERACEAPAGFVAVAGDCDDRSSDIGPDVFDVCNGLDDDCDGEVDPEPNRFYADADGDGYGTTELVFVGCDRPPGFVLGAGDCDDADRDALPGGVEVCNGRDDDCDGLVDDGADGDETWYRDLDGDGYGEESRQTCGRPGRYGWTEVGGDCDDGDYGRSPGRTEVCDGRDNDCDGDVDDRDPSLQGGTPAWIDLDGDGYGGQPAVQYGAYGVEALRLCTLAQPYVFQDGDCDDGDAGVSPANVERCGGGDEDCDGLVDDEDAFVGDAIEAYADADGDGYRGPYVGDACALGPDQLAVDAPTDCDDDEATTGPDLWVDDLDGDGFGAGGPVPGVACRPRAAGQVNVLRADCDDARVDVRPGVLDRCGDGLDADCSGFDPACAEPWTGGRAVTDARATLAVASPESASVADLDADGLPDLVVGAPGALSVVFGALPETYGQPVPALVEGADWSGAALGLRGRVLVGATDGWLDEGFVGADGSVAVGPSLLLTGRVNQLEAATVAPDSLGDPRVLVATAGLVYRLRLDRAPFEVEATVSTPAPAVLAPAGDLDGDGGSDLVVGVPARATVHVVAQEAPWGGVALAAASTWERVSTPGSSSGAAVGALDWDGDGLEDVVAGAPLDGTLGAQAGALVVASPAGGDLLTVFGAAGHLLGSSLAVVDLDGDGVDDLVVGAPGSDGGASGGGEAFGYLSGRLGTLDPSDADLVWTGSTDEGLAAGLRAADADGDGRDDLLLLGESAVHVLLGAP